MGEVHEAFKLYEDRVTSDYDWLSKEQLISENDKSAVYNAISEDLNLAAIGYYGSAITWESSNETLYQTQERLHP